MILFTGQEIYQPIDIERWTVNYKVTTWNWQAEIEAIMWFSETKNNPQRPSLGQMAFNNINISYLVVVVSPLNKRQTMWKPNKKARREILVLINNTSGGLRQ